MRLEVHQHWWLYACIMFIHSDILQSVGGPQEGVMGHANCRMHI